ncbi:unnamed protein product, partial [Musa acuminata subsp. burmannicoides]
RRRSSSSGGPSPLAPRSRNGASKHDSENSDAAVSEDPTAASNQDGGQAIDATEMS